MEEWDGYFRILLGGVDGKIVIGLTEGIREDEERDLNRDEIRMAIRRQKDNKAIRMDGIPEEIWKYEGEKMEKWV